MNVEEILSNISKLEDVSSRSELENIKALYTGKAGVITNLTQNFKTIPNEEKKEYGMELNKVKTSYEEYYKRQVELLNKKELDSKLQNERVDVTLPATKINLGAPNMLEKLVEDVEEVMISMGYDVVDGPEVEEDKYNFEMLNVPKGHPARDAQDTFYIEDDTILLRSQTSPVQVREMLKKGGKEPIRMICPGKVFRRDDDDATHSHQFVQIEGLLVDKKEKNVSLSCLKGTFEELMRRILGSDVSVRLRPSYYQFTEPSVEVDITCHKCKGKGCNICKNTGYITIAGGGIVHPNVLRGAGYDPEVWQGFAFGFGADRITMLKYGIEDLRVLYNNDLRETREFDRKEMD